MAERIDPVRDADAEARATARRLLAEARTACLAFLDPETGAPSVSRIGFGLAPDGAALTLLSDLAQHTRALRADPRAALLVGEPGPRGDPLNSARLSVSVTARFIANTDPARTPLRDLWLRDRDLSITVPPPAPDAAHTVSGTRVDPVFRDLDAMDINALLSDLNERLDGFVAEDLATDDRAGMQAVDSARRDHGTLRPDTGARRAPLYITPVWGHARVDSFEVKLRRFYGEVKDPWFWSDLDYGVAGLRFGPRANDRELFERYLKDKPLLYDTPEYVRFLRVFFEDHLMRFPFRTHEVALTNTIRAADMDSLKRILAHHDFLRNDRLCELVMLDQLYANFPGKTFDREGILRILRHAATASASLQLRLDYLRGIGHHSVDPLTEQLPGMPPLPKPGA